MPAKLKFRDVETVDFGDKNQQTEVTINDFRSSRKIMEESNPVWKFSFEGSKMEYSLHKNKDTTRSRPMRGED